MTKGIILAGGAGNRLYPISNVYSKQLVAIYDKPLIYYPLSILMLTGIKNILIISNKETVPFYKKLFADGSHLGISIDYAIQIKPKGIAEAFIIGENFIGKDQVVLILGDNIFYGYLDFLRNAIKKNIGATIFGYPVQDPTRFGIVEFDEKGKAISLEEKPKKPKSHFAIPGLYIYNNDVIKISKEIIPSARDELEITEVNKKYLNSGNLKVMNMGRGIAWLDTGTPQSLLEASSFIGAIEARQGLKIACIEEIAYKLGYIEKSQFVKLINSLPNCSYRNYLMEILK